MPDFTYSLDPWLLCLLIVAIVVIPSLIGLVLFRRFVAPHLRFDVDVNEAAGAAIQAIGVFYGITVGMLAVGVWTTHSNVADLVTGEAVSIGALYRDVSAYPEPVSTELRKGLREYTEFVIQQTWDAHSRGEIIDGGSHILNRFQAALIGFEPTTEGQKILHAEALKQYNDLIVARRKRVDSVGGGLSGSMWAVIWLGAIINLSVAYFLTIDDPRIHGALVGLIAAFIGLVIFVIAVYDNPFRGPLAVRPDSYQIIIDKVMDVIP